VKDFTYIKELTTEELLEFIRDMYQKDNELKKVFDFDAHIDELKRRGCEFLFITKADLIKALNEVDISEEENFYKFTPEMLVKELGFK